MKKLTFISSLFLLLFFAGIVYGGTYYVDTNGSDSGGDGSNGNPWRSVSHALNKVRSGDTISINNGTYSEGQMLVPPGVSITSTSKDKSLVTLKPNLNLGNTTPWIQLDNSSPGGIGNQSLSHISFNGINGGNRAKLAIRVRNRNNVRIHHCSFTDFRDAVFNPEKKAGTEPTIEVESTAISRGAKWWDYWPADPGPPGDDSSIDALWPAASEFVTGFEFDHNQMVRCHPINPYLLKDSSIHNNYIDNSETSEWSIQGTPAFFWNVDIYNNTFLARIDGYDDDGTKSSNVIFSAELWLWRGGCQFYNNVSNGFFSLTVGKETEIYGNASRPIAGTEIPTGGLGIEANTQSYCEIYDNYIGNNQNHGITVGLDHHGGGGTLDTVTVKNNVIVDAVYGGVTLVATSITGESVTVRNVHIYNNVMYGPRLNYGMKIDVDNNGGTALLENAYVKNNIMMNTGGTAGKSEGDGTVSNLTIDHNIFYGCNRNIWIYTADWKGPKTQTNTLIADPLFEGPTTTYEGFTLRADSPAIDAGIKVGSSFYGNNPDIGAIEYGVVSVNLFPPNNLEISVN